jgi:hypothetical protein
MAAKVARAHQAAVKPHWPGRRFHQALWRAPVLLGGIHLLFPLAVLLANGALRTVLSGQGGRILLRLLVRLLVGYAYVGLIEWAGRQLSARPSSRG